MQRKRGIIIALFGFCLFMSITVISMGLGVLFPSINSIAKPFVCPHGEIITESQWYHPYPGKNVKNITWWCHDQNAGTKDKLNFLILSLISGTIYGIILFVILFVIIKMKGSKIAPPKGTL